MVCDKNARTARALALFDNTFGTDNSHAVAGAMEPDKAIHYAAFASELADKQHQLYARLGISDDLKTPETLDIPQGTDPRIAARMQLQHQLKTWMTTKGHTDLDIRPDAILGDDIVHPVLEAHDRYMAELEKLQKSPTFQDLSRDSEALGVEIQRIKEETGYNAEIAQAKAELQARYGYGQDDLRFKYGQEWLNQSKMEPQAAPAKFLQWIGRNVAENMTRNKELLVYRHAFDGLRTGSVFGVGNYAKGTQDYYSARKAGSPEALQFTDHSGGFNIMHGIGAHNKGTTYYTAKNAALKAGMAEADAVKYGHAAVSSLQFSDHQLNQPRAFWRSKNPANILPLLKWHLAFRRWYINQAKQIVAGVKPGATPEQKRLAGISFKTMVTYNAVHALLFGGTSNIPSEVASPLEAAFPGLNALGKQIDKYSVSGLFDLDSAAMTRPSVTPVGAVTNLGIQVKQLAKLTDSLSGLMNHPTSTKILGNAVGTVAMLGDPNAIPVVGPLIKTIGVGNLEQLAGFMARVFTNNYTHYTVRGHRYETSLPEEAGNTFLRGGHESLSRQLQKARLDQGLPETTASSL